jgi:hypothetical protein
MDNQQTQPKEMVVLPEYATDFHQFKIDELVGSLVDPALQKYIWFKMMVLITNWTPDKDAALEMSKLQAYASMLPKNKNVTSQPPQPRKL